MGLGYTLLRVYTSFLEACFRFRVSDRFRFYIVIGFSLGMRFSGFRVLFFSWL